MRTKANAAASLNNLTPLIMHESACVIVMAIPEHMGFVQKRTWHKIKWLKNPAKMRVEGKFDIFDDEDLAKYKDFVEVIETFRTDMCATGVGYDFGKTDEGKIDAWIRENKC
ncbi:hypothetical protein HYU13_03795 [Candidatus Woesearchaeota archaeon]|nr:hypothetical protein [Candidatus Woesearchaeota archaeon]